MTTQEIASRYQQLMNERKFLEIQDTFYAPNVVCQEQEKAAAMGIPVFTHGLDAVKAKGIARRATIETTHSYYCSEPCYRQSEVHNFWQVGVQNFWQQPVHNFWQQECSTGIKIKGLWLGLQKLFSYSPTGSSSRLD